MDFSLFREPERLVNITIKSGLSYFLEEQSIASLFWGVELMWRFYLVSWNK